MVRKLKLGGMLYLVGFGGAVLLGALEGLGWLPDFLSTTLVLMVLAAAGLLLGALNVSEAEAKNVILGALGLGISAGVFLQFTFVGVFGEAILARVAALSLAVAVVPSVRLVMNSLK